MLRAACGGAGVEARSVSGFRRVSLRIYVPELAGASGASLAAFSLSLFLYGCTEGNIKAFYKKKEISLWIVDPCGVFATDMAIDSRIRAG
jgi:hypothetical protein